MIKMWRWGPILSFIICAAFVCDAAPVSDLDLTPHILNCPADDKPPFKATTPIYPFFLVSGEDYTAKVYLRSDKANEPDTLLPTSFIYLPEPKQTKVSIEFPTQPGFYSLKFTARNDKVVVGCLVIDLMAKDGGVVGVGNGGTDGPGRPEALISPGGDNRPESSAGLSSTASGASCAISGSRPFGWTEFFGFLMILSLLGFSLRRGLHQRK